MRRGQHRACAGRRIKENGYANSACFAGDRGRDMPGGGAVLPVALSPGAGEERYRHGGFGRDAPAGAARPGRPCAGRCGFSGASRKVCGWLGRRSGRPGRRKRTGKRNGRGDKRGGRRCRPSFRGQRIFGFLGEWKRRVGDGDFPGRAVGQNWRQRDRCSGRFNGESR